MQIGDKIPEFSLLDQNGVKRSNKGLKNPLVLFFLILSLEVVINLKITNLKKAKGFSKINTLTRFTKIKIQFFHLE